MGAQQSEPLDGGSACLVTRGKRHVGLAIRAKEPCGSSRNYGKACAGARGRGHAGTTVRDKEGCAGARDRAMWEQQ